MAFHICQLAVSKIRSGLVIFWSVLLYFRSRWVKWSSTVFTDRENFSFVRAWYGRVWMPDRDFQTLWSKVLSPCLLTYGRSLHFMPLAPKVLKSYHAQGRVEIDSLTLGRKNNIVNNDWHHANPLEVLRAMLKFGDLVLCKMFMKWLFLF